MPQQHRGTCHPLGGQTESQGRTGKCNAPHVGERPCLVRRSPMYVEFVVEISRCRAPLHRSTTQALRPAADVELYSSRALQRSLYSSTALQRSTLYILYTLPQSTIKLLYGPGIASPGLARLRDIVHTVCLYNKLTDTPPPRARPGPSRPSSSSEGPRPPRRGAAASQIRPQSTGTRSGDLRSN